MPKSIYLFILIYVFLNPSNAIAYSSDSLVNILENGNPSNKKKTEILDKLITISNEDGDFNAAAAYAKQAISISVEVDNSGDEVYFSSLCATAHQNAENYFDALEYYRYASELAEENEWFVTQSSIVNNIGIIYYLLGDELKGLEYFLQSLSLKEKYDESKDYTGALINIGGIYNSLGDSEEGLVFLNRAYENALEVEDVYMQSKALINIGDVYNNSGLYDTALNNFTTAIILADSIKDWQTKANILIKIGTTWSKKGIQEKSLSYFLQSFHLSNSIQYDYGISVAAQRVGEFYTQVNNRNRATNFFRKAAIHSEKISAASNMLENYKSLSEVYKSSGNPEESLTYFSLYSNLKDSLSNVEEDEKYSSIKALYELDKKQREVDNLTLENELVELQAKQSRYFLYGSFGLIILLVLIVILIFRQHQVRSLQKTIRLEQKLLRSQINPHFIFNALTAVQRFIFEKSTLVASDYLGTFSKLIRFILNSSTVEKVSLSEEIEFLRNYLDLQAIRFEHKFKYAIIVEDELNTSEIYIPPMLTQPIVENAVEHGVKHLNNAGQIKLSYRLLENHMEIEIEDNGVGREKSAEINQKKNINYKSLSTDITNERLLHFNKKFGTNINLKYIDLKNKNNEVTGTRVLIRVPYSRSGI